jgi:hypothetical protein
MSVMGEDEDQSKVQDEGPPENVAKAEAAKAGPNCFAHAWQDAPAKHTWLQLWGLRAAWCVTVIGLIGLVAVPSRWVLSEREAARVLNVDMLAINSRPTFAEARARVPTQAPAGVSEVPAENEAVPDLLGPESAPALSVATGGPIISQKRSRETVHAKPSAPGSKIGKTRPKKAAAVRKAVKKARGPVLAKSKSEPRPSAQAGPRSKLHVGPGSRARTHRLEAAPKQNRTVSGKKARQCAASTNHGRRNCDRVKNR